VYSFARNVLWTAIGLALFAWHRICQLVPRDTIVVDGKTYLTRYFVGDILPFKPRVWLHYFHISDPGDELHDHPWSGWSLILRGGYIEERMTVVDRIITNLNDYSFRVDNIYEKKVRVLRPGDINRLGPLDFHRVDLLGAGCWTLFVPGKRNRDWQFLGRDGTLTPWQLRKAEGYKPEHD
jgi:hypothetical protein